MKHLSALLLLALCATATTSAQTIKSLGYNTTNGHVVYAGTNSLTFTNEVTLIGNFYSGKAAWVDDASSTFLRGFSIITNTIWFPQGVGAGGDNIVGPTLGIFGLGFNNSTLIKISSGQINFEVAPTFTNSSSATRTNLGLPWDGLTNTNAATFQSALFSSTNTAPTNTNAPTSDAWVDIQVGANTYKIPLWQ